LSETPKTFTKSRVVPYETRTINNP